MSVPGVGGNPRLVRVTSPRRRARWAAPPKASPRPAAKAEGAAGDGRISFAMSDAFTPPPGDPGGLSAAANGLMRIAADIDTQDTKTKAAVATSISEWRSAARGRLPSRRRRASGGADHHHHFYRADG